MTKYTRRKSDKYSQYDRITFALCVLLFLLPTLAWYTYKPVKALAVDDSKVYSSTRCISSVCVSGECWELTPAVKANVAIIANKYSSTLQSVIVTPTNQKCE